MTSPPRWTSVLAIALPAALLAALPLRNGTAQTPGEVIIYRCVAADGSVTLQNNAPCPKDSQQTIRRVAPVTTVPAPASRPAARPASPVPATGPAQSAPPQPAPQPAPPPPLARSAPPPLFQCRTWDERDYFGDNAEPRGTCVAVEARAIDGSDAHAAGETCEMRYDTCEPVVDDQLCAAWKKRVDEAEFRWKFAGARNDARKAEYDRYAKIYRESTCGG